MNNKSSLVLRLYSLPKGAKEILYGFGVYTFEDFVRMASSIKGPISEIKKIKTRERILMLISDIEEFEAAAESANSLPLSGEIKGNSLFELPLLLFYEIIPSKILRIFYENNRYFCKDIYIDSNNNNLSYIYWNKIIDSVEDLKADGDESFDIGKISEGGRKLLQFNNIKNIEDIRNRLSSYEDFRGLYLSNRQLFVEFQGIVSKNKKNTSIIKEYTDATFIEKLHIFSMKIQSFDRGVFIDRYFGGLTLEEVGKNLKLTRERVRQIEERSALLIQPLLNEILKVEIEKTPSFKQILNEKPILLPEYFHLLSFLGVEDFRSIEILELTSELGLIRTGRNEFAVVRKEFKELPYGEIGVYIKNFRSNNFSIGINEIDIESLYYQLIAEGIIEGDKASATYLKAFINALLKDRYLVVKDESSLSFMANKISTISIIEEIIRKNGPLHYKEVKEILVSDYGIVTKERNVHAALSRPGKFVNVGKGTYDIVGSKYSGKNVVQLVSEYLESKGCSQKLSDIEDFVLSKKKVKRESVFALMHSRPNLFGKNLKGEFGLTTFSDIISFSKSIKHSRIYKYNSEQAFNILKNNGELDTPFTFNSYRNKLKSLFGGDVSLLKQTNYPFLRRLVLNKSLIKKNHFYILNK